MIGTIIQIALTGITTGIVAFMWRKDARSYADLKTLYVVAVARNKQLEAENGLLQRQLEVFTDEFSKGAIAHAAKDKTIASDGDATTVVDALVKRLQTPLGGIRTNRSTGNTAQAIPLPITEPSATDNDKPNPE